MKHVFLLLLSVITLNSFSQSYKDKVSFKSDLWLVQTFEEGSYIPPDTLSITWEKKKIKEDKYAIYVDISEKGTLIGIKYPSKLTLSSEGLPNNGFMGEKWFGKYSMYIQSTVKDETGYVWWVTVGKTRYLKMKKLEKMVEYIWFFRTLKGLNQVGISLLNLLERIRKS